MMNETEKLMKGSVHEEDYFIINNYLVLLKSKETINLMRQRGCLHRWLLPLNGLQDGTPYVGHPVANSPEFVPLDNSLDCDILHSLNFNSILSCYILDGEGTDEEEMIMRFSY